MTAEVRLFAIFFAAAVLANMIVQPMLGWLWPSANWIPHALAGAAIYWYANAVRERCRP